MTSPSETTTSSRPIAISPPKKSSSAVEHSRNRYRSPNPERNMPASIPINIPRMPPSNPSSSSSPSATTAAVSGQHRYGGDLPFPGRPSSGPRERGESPSSGRSPTISSSYSHNRSHPYPPRRLSSNSQPERERERERERDVTLPRIHLPPPNSLGSLKFPERDRENNYQHQLSPLEREFPLSIQSQNESSSASASSWRNPSGSDRPVINRIPSEGSIGKSGGISLPPLHSISGSPILAPPSSSLSMSIGSNNHMPPPNFDSSSSSGRASPRGYSSTNISRQNYGPYDTHRSSQRRSPGASTNAGSSKLRDHEIRQSQSRHLREPSREELFHSSSRRGSLPHSTVPLPNHSSSHRYQNQNQHQHQHHSHAYEIPSPPLRALPPSSMPPVSYVSSYGHRSAQGSGSSLARSRSHSATSGFSRHGMDIDESGASEIAPTPGQSRRLAHLMSEQKRRESINSGFQALRQALPSSLPTDSKAIILRKAVAHITHLESIVRRSGLPYSQSPPGPMTDWGPSEEARDDEDDNRVKWEEDR
ncbi:uncharacterized protein IL334_007585 [Kwoniella shivajii]|uniref:BHLH domain-containing protein n=1 Tax=Kwoniella shivajii TaxID=564305 RepID=A0ABZ1DD11_9TREE|nr:hypothetical protein IL334_007585 [Kwoniella shivajii]